MVAITTLGHLRDSSMGMYAHCRARNLGHGRELDIHKLIANFGEDYVFICDERIGNETVCTHPGCGHIGADIRLIAETRSRYGKTAP